MHIAIQLGLTILVIVIAVLWPSPVTIGSAILCILYDLFITLRND